MTPAGTEMYTWGEKASLGCVPQTIISPPRIHFATRRSRGMASATPVPHGPTGERSHPPPSPEPIKPLILEPTTPYGARQARITM